MVSTRILEIELYARLTCMPQLTIHCNLNSLLKSSKVLESSKPNLLNSCFKSYYHINTSNYKQKRYFLLQIFCSENSWGTFNIKLPWIFLVVLPYMVFCSENGCGIFNIKLPWIFLVEQPSHDEPFLMWHVSWKRLPMAIIYWTPC